MAVVSKQEIKVLDETFIKIVKYSANTEKFTIELPKKAQKKMGKMVTGGTLSEVNERFSFAIQAFKETSTSNKKVILLRVEATIKGVSEIDGGFYKLEDVGYEQEGAALSMTCGVFRKYTTNIPGLDDRFDYEYIESDFPPGFDRIKDDWMGKDDFLELPWTQGYEDLLKNLAVGFQTLIFKLLDVLRTKKSIDNLLITGQKVLPGQVQKTADK